MMKLFDDFVYCMICVFVMINIDVSAQVEQEHHKFTNRLIDETSPYLLQHAHNPVDWYPWGDEAFEKARDENKLLLISIGYSACHLCHVMESECFENQLVAEFMNANFVCVKVDKEEHPDVDMIYMNAIQLLTGSGGWPINCIALSDARPIYGGTYFSKDNWMRMLKNIVNYACEKPKEIEEQADRLTKGIVSSGFIDVEFKHAEFTTKNLDDIFTLWQYNIDFVKGGRKRAPKFPMPSAYQFMLNYDNKRANEALMLSLKAMCRGGIYDQIGGGFARYSTDEDWRVPHFEKMLYDNAQLISLYSKAYQKTKNKEFKQVAIECLAFIKREMTSDKFAFYSSIDADSNGKEGVYYVWRKNEIEKILSPDDSDFIKYFNVSDEGNWANGNNVLYINLKDSFPLQNSKFSSYLKNCKKKLLDYRYKRIRPLTDDKILCSWNALMLKAYADAYMAFDDKEYLDVAMKNADFIINNFVCDNNKLKRNYKNNITNIDGFLDDYAFTIDAFITLYQNSFETKYLTKALDLSSYVIEHFYDKNSGMFYYTSDVGSILVARKMEIVDNVIPASNSQMAINLFKLAQYYDRSDYLIMSSIMLNNVKNRCMNGGVYYANWNLLMSYFVNEIYNIAIIGPDNDILLKEFNKYFLPYVFFSGDKKRASLSLHRGKYIRNRTYIYVCKNKTCGLPIISVKKALQILKE